MKRYGYIEQDLSGYPLAAWIWGHRLRVGQHWMEYLLEFLNVLAGFDYELGQGITEGAEVPSLKLEYTRFTRLGLRRFVFYDEREKTRHPFDDLARQLLQQALQTQVTVASANSTIDPLALVRGILRSFSAVEEQRSWYAKSLFPAHHSMLFWEGLRKGATKYKGRRVLENTPPRLLDQEVAFDPRNFFARGGEIYYLVLSAGTQQRLDQRGFIANRLRTLLVERNQAIGQLAEIIDTTWQQLAASATAQRTQRREHTGRLGWIPEPDCPLYAVFAEDVATFLGMSLDPLETLDLLGHLIGFHLTLYIYYHAAPAAPMQDAADSTEPPFQRLTLLVDAMDGADNGVIRDVSAALFREQEARIIQRARAYVDQQVQGWVASLTTGGPSALWLEAKEHFHLSSLRGTTRRPFEQRFDGLLLRHTRGQIDQDSFLEQFTSLLMDILMGDFRKNFLGVHSKLAKRVGFVAPRKGASGRFVLGDTLLKTLTLANLPVGTEMPFDLFLNRLHERYGIVVGPDQARQSGLFRRQSINAEYYDRNKAALLEKMQRAGLAVEYSDATAIVIGTLR